MLETAKTILDVAGFLPVVGTAANLASAGISLAQGKYGEAALSAAAAIPVVGVLGETAKGAKLLQKGVKAGEELAEGGAKVAAKVGTEAAGRGAEKAAGKEATAAAGKGTEEATGASKQANRATPGTASSAAGVVNSTSTAEKVTEAGRYWLLAPVCLPVFPGLISSSPRAPRPSRWSAP